MRATRLGLDETSAAGRISTIVGSCLTSTSAHTPSAASSSALAGATSDISAATAMRTSASRERSSWSEPDVRGHTAGSPIRGG
jgi:hypothetical protein